MGVIEMQTADYIIFGGVALFNAAGHWFPWAIISMADARGLLRRPWSYLYGTLSILAGLALGTLIRAEQGDATIWIWHSVLYTLICACAAGTGTLIPYLIDMIREHQALNDDVHDLEELARG